MKIRPVGAELFHADGQTDMTKLIVAFCNFSNAPKHPGVCRFFVYSPTATLPSHTPYLPTLTATAHRISPDATEKKNWILQYTTLNALIIQTLENWDLVVLVILCAINTVYQRASSSTKGRYEHLMAKNILSLRVFTMCSPLEYPGFNTLVWHQV
jgi:hypothetical protein